MRRRTADRLTAIEDRLEAAQAALASVGQKTDAALARLALMDDRTADLAGTIRDVMAARGEHDAAVAADAKAARTAAESAFVACQSLAAVATAQPGLGELAGAVATNTEAVRAVPAAVVKALQTATVTAAAKTQGKM